MSENRRAKKMIRIDDDIDRFLVRQMRAKESYGQTLRRLLGVGDDRERREQSRPERRRAS